MSHEYLTIRDGVWQLPQINSITAGCRRTSHTSTSAFHEVRARLASTTYRRQSGWQSRTGEFYGVVIGVHGLGGALFGQATPVGFLDRVQPGSDAAGLVALAVPGDLDLGRKLDRAAGAGGHGRRAH